MQAVTIDNKLNLCNKLFFGQVFDDFLFLEGSITTNCSFTMDGRLQKAYYSAEEQKKYGVVGIELCRVQGKASL